MTTTADNPGHRRHSVVASLFRGLFRLLVVVSFGINLVLILLLVRFFFYSEDTSLRERLYAGKKLANDKIAVVRIEGVIVEGMLGYARKQIEEAAADEAVKAVVLQINSPGGSITASDDLYHRLVELRDGNPSKKTQPKPIIVSMASVAASGGYYIAMPAKQICAERTTITGSIGVYASFPNISELAESHGVKMNTIKAGRVKDSGSMFHAMTPTEQLLWQELVDHAYAQFLGVVKEGRGNRLKYPLTAEIPEEKRLIPANVRNGQAGPNGGPSKGAPLEFGRQLADGGIYTSDKALAYGLIDQIGYLDDAIELARQAAGLEADFKAVTYERPQTFLQNLVLGQQTPPPSNQWNWNRLPTAFTPHVWYLMPESGLSGYIAAATSN